MRGKARRRAIGSYQPGGVLGALLDLVEREGSGESRVEGWCVTETSNANKKKSAAVD